MADNKVIRSVEAFGGDRCVDIFRRPDGSWGFEEYRRDIEDLRGWQVIGFYGEKRFGDRVSAEMAAAGQVAWLEALPKS